MRRPRRARPASSAPERRHDDQHVDGRRGVEERAPGGGDREQRGWSRGRSIAPTSTTGRSARSRACHGSARMPITDSGMPRKTRTLKHVVGQALHAHLERAAPGPPRGSATRVGGSFQAKMSKPVTESAFETAWPGQRVAEDDPVAGRPGREHQQAHDGDHADQPQALRRAASRPRRIASQAQTIATQSASLRVSAAAPTQQAHRQQARVQEARAPRVAQHARHQQAGAQGEHPEQDRGVRLDGVEQQRQVDRGGEARSRSPASARGPAPARAPRRRPPPGARPARTGAPRGSR